MPQEDRANPLSRLVSGWCYVRYSECCTDIFLGETVRKLKINKSGGILSNMRLKQGRKDINMADFDSKVEGFKTAVEFSDSLGGGNIYVNLTETAYRTGMEEICLTQALFLYTDLSCF